MLNKENFYNTNIFLILVLIFGFSFISCSSIPDAPDCINKSSINSVLKWGIIEDNELLTYHTLKTNGKLQAFDNNNIEISDEDNPVYLHQDTICTLMREIGRLILKHQVLSIPSNHNNFIEYRNDDRNYYFRALWDPNFENQGNKEFIEFYNRLEKITEDNDNINSR